MTSMPVLPISEALLASAPMGKLRVVVTYMEMTRPARAALSFQRPSGARILRAKCPTASFYRYLYNCVGNAWLWYERRLLNDQELLPLIRKKCVEIYVLYSQGIPAGYVEFDRGSPDAVEIVYFGLLPEFIGRGLGPYFLDWSIGRAWAPRSAAPPKRVWLHTCTLDHPKALRTYLRAGFSAYDQHERLIDDPRLRVSFN